MQVTRYWICREDWNTGGMYQPQYDTGMVRAKSECWGDLANWVEVELPELLMGGYYSGGSVEVSNYRVFLESFPADDSGPVRLFSTGYGGFGVLIDVEFLTGGTDLAGEIRETLERLENYPVLDDDDLCQVEMAAEDEAWESWARRDTERSIEERFGLSGFFDTRELNYGDFADWADRANLYWVNETGNSAWFDVDRLVKTLELSDLVDAGYCTLPEMVAYRLTGDLS